MTVAIGFSYPPPMNRGNLRLICCTAFDDQDSDIRCVLSQLASKSSWPIVRAGDHSAIMNTTDGLSRHFDLCVQNSIWTTFPTGLVKKAESLLLRFLTNSRYGNLSARMQASKRYPYDFDAFLDHHLLRL